MAKLFEYVVLYHPKQKKDKDGNTTKGKSVLLVDVKRVLAESDREVSILASREIGDEYIDKLDQVEIVVRPF